MYPNQTFPRSFYVCSKLVLLLGLAVTFNWLTTTSHSAAAGPCLTPARIAGRGINDNAVADFDGDGKMDLALANQTYHNISILLGDGTGGFGQEMEYGPEEEARSPDAMAVGDFNSDGKPDIATANSSTRNVTVYLNDGQGRFDNAKNYEGGGLTSSIVTADFNSDGHADLALASRLGDGVIILNGDGAGHFTRASSIPLSNTYFIAGGDFNGDGKADLVNVGSSLATGSILLGNGNGGFATAELYVGPPARLVAVGELNQDGFSDLIIGLQNGDIAVMLGQGTGTFAPPTNFSTRGLPRDIAVGDFTNDGVIDIAIGYVGVSGPGAGPFAILPGNGTGGFGATQTYNNGVGVSAVAAGDFNSDGSLDVATGFYDGTDSAVSVLLSVCTQTSPAPPARTTYTISGRVENGAFIHVTLTGTRGYSAQTDGDGNYSLNNLPAGGNYFLTPETTSGIYTYTSSPKSLTFNNLSSNQTANFTRTLNTHTITGRVTNTAGVGLAGIIVGGTAITDANGYYSLTLAAGLRYDIGARHSTFAYRFDKVVDIPILDSDRVINFVGLGIYNISGRVVDLKGVPVSGIYIYVNGPDTRSVTTDSDGRYTAFHFVEGSNLTVNTSPDYRYTYQPLSQQINNLSSHQTVNFTLIRLYSVSGNVRDAEGKPISGATLTLSGNKTGTTTSNSNGNYVFDGVPEQGSFTVTPLKGSQKFSPASQTFNDIGGNQSNVNFTAPFPSQAAVKTWTQNGTTFAHVLVTFPNAGYVVADWGQVGPSGGDYSTDITIQKLSGPVVAAPVTSVNIYTLGQLPAGNYTFTFKNLGIALAQTSFTVNTSAPAPNPIDTHREFIRWQYKDFLGREPDAAGWDYWTANIARCEDAAQRSAGQTLEQCVDKQRTTTSAAFFLSPEFQYTGYYVYRLYKGVLGRAPYLSEFTPDRAFVNQGIINTTTEQLDAARINQNKAELALRFTGKAEFIALYDVLNNQQYVDKLFQTTKVTVSDADKQALVNGLNNSTETRATVLQKVVDGVTIISEGNQQFNTTYGKAFYDREFNNAFVQMEYFGYMRRDPDGPGYEFWLGKLNQYGDYVDAEMVRSFIVSPEYRSRFGQP